MIVEASPIVALSSKLSILSKFRLRVSSMENDLLNLSEYDFIGGFIPGPVNSNEYWGVGIIEYVLASYFHGSFGLQYEVKRNIFLQAMINYLDTEHPMSWIYPDVDVGLIGDNKRTFSFGGLVGIKSPVGPISFAFAKDQNRSDWKGSLILGFYF